MHFKVSTIKKDSNREKEIIMNSKDDLEINKCSETCPMEFAMTQISGKWKLVILWHIYDKRIIRYGELKRSVSNITDKMLSNQLKELVSDNIIHKEVYQEIPPKVEYSLTEYGKSLIPIMEMLFKWGQEHLDKIENI